MSERVPWKNFSPKSFMRITTAREGERNTHSINYDASATRHLQCSDSWSTPDSALRRTMVQCETDLQNDAHCSPRAVLQILRIAIPPEVSTHSPPIYSRILQIQHMRFTSKTRVKDDDPQARQAPPILRSPLSTKSSLANKRVPRRDVEGFECAACRLYIVLIRRPPHTASVYARSDCWLLHRDPS